MSAGRILVTGSRTWDDYMAIHEALVVENSEWTLVSGACPRGADAIAEQIWGNWGNPIERHPADWSIGRHAGILRNRFMVDLGADICFAFIKDGSRGATHCADLAEARGIPTYRWTETTR